MILHNIIRLSDGLLKIFQNKKSDKLKIPCIFLLFPYQLFTFPCCDSKFHETKPYVFRSGNIRFRNREHKNSPANI